LKRKIHLSFILATLFLIISIAISSISKETVVTTDIVKEIVTSEIKEDDEEMRGLWVSYLSLDMQNDDKTFEAFSKRFDDIIAKAKELKCNTLIVQVRPFADALYYSSLFPHSHILSGEQGVSPGYDALEYMCKSAHKNSLKIHCWINPLRIKNDGATFELASNNPYIISSDICINVNNNIYLNPSKEEARKLITDGIIEIIEKYPIDGIQFDDYFYPEDITDEDTLDYNLYIESINTQNTPMELDIWRENNINLLIAESYKAIKNTDKDIVFGISPQGNIDNNKKIYANPKLWCETIGYIDYICPQLYYSTENPALTFENALSQWSEFSHHNNIKVYIGLAAYKAGSDADENTWSKSNTILKEELNLLREYNYDGYMIYEYRSLKEGKAQEEIENFKNEI